jgi:ankyrin repeat protein
MYAAWNGQLQVVKELLARGANIDTTSRNNWTAKTAASDAGHLEILKLLTGDKRT